MKPIELVRTIGGQAVALRDAATIVVGRAPDCDLHIPDPTVSRRHAELSVESDGVHVRDLGSSNGTFVNGTRTDRGTAQVGDVITFGRVACALRQVGAPGEAAPVAGTAGQTPAGGEGTIVRQIRVDPPAGWTPGAGAPAAETRRAARTPDPLLERVLDLTFQLMKVDHASVMLLDPDTNDLTPAVSRGRFGEDDGDRQVPTSIARRVAHERIAVLTDNAAADVRFKGQSIVLNRVRSAMCTPLMARDGTVLGIFYVDNRTATRSFTDDDLQFLIVYAGIAAAAIEGGQLAEGRSREAVLRSELYRHFPADIAESIAVSGDAVALKVRRLPLVAVFAELRGVPTTVADASPERVAAFLTTCTREMVSVVFEHGGSVDRTIDGAILALWGAPVPGDDDADRAVEAVVAMLDRLNRLNREDAARGMPRIRLGAGISIGDAFGGNVGDDGYEYAVYGRPIDAARHLAAQAGPGEVLLTGPVLDALSMRPAVAAMYTPMRRRDADQAPVYRLKQ